MSISIKIQSGEDQPFAIELEGFPTVVELEKTELPLSLIPFGFFFLAFLFLALKNVSIDMALVVVLAVGAVLALLLLRGLMRRGRKNVIRFEKRHVEVLEAGKFWDTSWQADYTEFKRVVMRKRRLKARRGRATYQIIELQHDDQTKTLPLFVDLTQKAPTKRWNHYADLFNLPAEKEGY